MYYLQSQKYLNFFYKNKFIPMFKITYHHFYVDMSLSLIENWKLSLDRKGYGGAILMDLSKAFDTINYDLLLAKVHAYGFDEKLT